MDDCSDRFDAKQLDANQPAEAKPKDWLAYLASEPVASEGFMADVEDRPMKDREQ